MKLARKALEKSQAPRRSEDVLVEGIQKERKHYGFWSSMTYEDLISYARNFIKEKGIKNRSSLAETCQSLYGILRKRNLLDTVFPNVEEPKKSIKKNKMIEQAELDYKKTIRLILGLLGGEG